MKIDDPFGRAAARRERDYETLRDALAAAGVSTRAEAERCLARVMRNALLMAALLALSVLLAAAWFPAFLPVVALCAAMALAWLAATTVNSRRHLRRYIEELGRNAGGS